jgi:hypothetical protein
MGAHCASYTQLAPVGGSVIADKQAAKAILLAGAAELTEMELDQMAKFYRDGTHTTAALSIFCFAHVWAATAKGSAVPLGCIDGEIERLAPGPVRSILQRVRGELARLDT